MGEIRIKDYDGDEVFRDENGVIWVPLQDVAHALIAAQSIQK